MASLRTRQCLRVRHTVRRPLAYSSSITSLNRRASAGDKCSNPAPAMEIWREFPDPAGRSGFFGLRSGSVGPSEPVIEHAGEIWSRARGSLAQRRV